MGCIDVASTMDHIKWMMGKATSTFSSSFSIFSSFFSSIPVHRDYVDPEKLPIQPFGRHRSFRCDIHGRRTFDVASIDHLLTTDTTSQSPRDAKPEM